MGIVGAVGFLLDIVLGDPSWFPHPVRGIGLMINRLEAFIRKYARTPAALKAGGVVLTLVTVGSTYLITWFLLKLCWRISPWLYFGVSAAVVYFTLATRCLAYEASLIYQALKRGDLELAQKRLSYIVGRDTDNLPEGEITRGAVETVAENTVDGVVSPLLYTFLGGPALGMAYKAVNTLDSMVGYLNDKYRDLGWASARLDDAANWLPARITAFLMLISGLFWGKSIKRGYMIFRRDRRNHKSPNGGYPEAAMAGLLGVQIGGTNHYFGERVYKPTIGDPCTPLNKEHIRDSIKILYTTAFLALAILWLVSSWGKEILC